MDGHFVADSKEFGLPARYCTLDTQQVRLLKERLVNLYFKIACLAVGIALAGVLFQYGAGWFPITLYFLGVLCICAALIVLVRSCRRLNESFRAVETAAATKSLFLARMSHEIRTPINGILGTLELLLDSKLPQEHRELLWLGKESCHALITIVDDLLDFSRIEAGDIEFSTETVDVQTLVDRSMMLLGIRAREKGLVALSMVEADVPKFVRADPVRLGQVVNNLLSNALKFTSSHGIVFLWVGVEQSGGQWVDLHFCVSDNGDGIPPDKLDAVFAPFAQADVAMARRYGGTGLGLSICRKIVEAMGGRIWVCSRVHVGSAFHFSVRLDRVESRKSDLHPAPFRQSESEGTLAQPGKILLVDDNTINRRLAQVLLEKWGHEVISVDNGESGLEAFRERDFDLVLMDCQMPVLDGYQTTMLLRDMERGRTGRVPVVALTACALASEKDRCLAAGMDDFVSKPYESEKLLEVVERYLRRNPACSP